MPCEAVRARLGSADVQPHSWQEPDWSDVRAAVSNLCACHEEAGRDWARQHKAGPAGGAALTSLIEADDPDRLLLIVCSAAGPRCAECAMGTRHRRARRPSVQVWPVDLPNSGWVGSKRLAKIGLSIADGSARDSRRTRSKATLLATIRNWKSWFDSARRKSRRGRCAWQAWPTVRVSTYFDSLKRACAATSRVRCACCWLARRRH